MKSFKLLIASAIFAFAGLAQAATVSVDTLDFGTGLLGSGGTIEDVGGTIEGVGIDIGSLTVIYDGTETTYETVASLDFNTTQNTMTISGDVGALGLSSVDLFTGGFTTSSFAGGIFTATGGGDASSELLTALDMPAGAFSYIAFSLEMRSGTVVSTDILAERTSRTPEVPIPAAAWLFGSGLLGLVGIARRKPLDA